MRKCPTDSGELEILDTQLATQAVRDFIRMLKGEEHTDAESRPLVFKCAKCKRGVEYTASGNDWFAPHGKPMPTGEIRDRDGIAYAQYRCAQCGHTGWTRHPSMLSRVGDASKAIEKASEA